MAMMVLVGPRIESMRKARGEGEMHLEAEKAQPAAKKKKLSVTVAHKTHECFFSLVANMQVHNLIIK